MLQANPLAPFPHAPSEPSSDGCDSEDGEGPDEFESESEDSRDSDGVPYDTDDEISGILKPQEESEQSALSAVAGTNGSASKAAAEKPSKTKPAAIKSAPARTAAAKSLGFKAGFLTGDLRSPHNPEESCQYHASAPELPIARDAKVALLCTCRRKGESSSIYQGQKCS